MNGKDRLASLKTDRDRLKRELLATTRSNTKLLEHVSVLTKRRIELERHLLEASTACHGRGEHERRGVDGVKPRLARQRAKFRPVSCWTRKSPCWSFMFFLRPLFSEFGNAFQ